MFLACWSAKGGAGATVVVSALGLLFAKADPAGCILADLTGDVPSVLGATDPISPGLAGWLRAGDTVPADALSRLEVDVAPGLAVQPRGAGIFPSERGCVLAALFERSRRTVVVDCGNLARAPIGGVEQTVAQRATRSLLVIRPCYQSIQHAQELPVRPTGAIAIVAGKRSVGVREVERSLDVPVIAEIPEDPAVARAVDAGLLHGRLPRALSKGLGDAL